MSPDPPPPPGADRSYTNVLHVRGYRDGFLCNNIKTLLVQPVVYMCVCVRIIILRISAAATMSENENENKRKKFDSFTVVAEAIVHFVNDSPYTKFLYLIRNPRRTRIYLI